MIYEKPAVKSFVFLFMVLVLSCAPDLPKDNLKARKNPDGLKIKLTNGNWFNGENFTKRDVWVDEGLLSFSPISKPMDTVMDLTGKYIIPPFAEAHNHNLESAYKLQDRIDSYLNNGVFYVKLLSSIKKRIDPLMHHYNKPLGLDVSLAHAPLTANGGHPIALRKRYLHYGYFKGLFNTIGDIESHGFFIINNCEDLDNQWERILSFGPDFIKIMLLYSEEYEIRKSDTTYFGHKGLDPKVVPEIVERAHKSGLRVSAHVETTHDFHVAVKAGVDEIAHLPEIDNGKPIAEEHAILAKEKDVVVTTTVSLVTKKKEKPEYGELVENIRSNLILLKKKGVKLAIGSDMYNDNSLGEFQLLHNLNVFTNLELLKMWTENSAMTIFPNRKIGFLREGYEASFLVLNKNPLKDISDITETIEMRVKQGALLK